MIAGDELGGGGYRWCAVGGEVKVVAVVENDVGSAAMAMTTALGRPISLLPMKNTALYWRVSGLPAASKGRLST